MDYFWFDLNGVHFSDKKISETMTGSGFCLNILMRFLKEDYLLYKEWDTPSFLTEDYLEKY
mgnify:CR=1 FL=1|jgi:hypothetical protein|tara:strand:+ start:321 stop:503 length:183 start_codon:yes stop_codon:yes gene_type:complete